jgi:hypothetical protein
MGQGQAKPVVELELMSPGRAEWIGGDESLGSVSSAGEALAGGYECLVGTS